ncbi:MAG: putative esterase [Verrucomicrobiales bacterium]|nr:putative esterase [Verrucomicrobiales bacterium]MDB6129129.1 putative esterase [Verrucomicrobiales bacterium]
MITLSCNGAVLRLNVRSLDLIMKGICYLTCSVLLCLASITSALGKDDYVLGADSKVQEGIPKGEVSKFEWRSKIFTNTVREYYVYVPKQYDAATPAAVMVFQDGRGYTTENGAWRIPTVFDNLIHRKEMPVTIGIFINPGTMESTNAAPGAQAASNRSPEYDALGDTYARFLLEEILPEVGKKYNLTKDPEGRAICGSSSGGICAFTVAWERPNEFRKVISSIGSFTNIRGGYVYPAWIRKTESKPIRVFLQDGSSDLDNQFGNWPLANQQMASALEFAKYDYKFVFGDGGHTSKHMASIMPDALRWLWRDYKPSGK